MRKKEIIAIEDSTSGLAAATEAGLSCLLTLTEWNNFSKICMSDAKAVANHLGDNGKPCSIIQGLPCPNDQINFQYLQDLINQ